MVLLNWPPPDHLSIGRKSWQVLPCQQFTNARADIPAEQTSQLTREQSPWPEFGWIPGNLRELSKGYFAPTFLSSSPTTSARQSGLRHPQAPGRGRASRGKRL